MRRSVFILSSLLAVLSCSKEDRRAVEKAMEFSVNIPEVTVTKAEVTESGLTGGTDKVYVYGMMSDGTSSIPVFESPGVAGLYYDNTAKIWNPKQGNDVVKWENDYYYRFYGYAYSSNASVGTDLIIANDIYGRQFTVTQPGTASWTAPSAAGAASDGSGTIDSCKHTAIGKLSSCSSSFRTCDEQGRGRCEACTGHDRKGKWNKCEYRRNKARCDNALSSA